jgi:hypothetical protein
MARRFDPPHGPFPLARRLVRVLPTIIEISMLLMLDSWQDLPLRRAIARQLIRDDDSRDVAQPLQQLAEARLRGGLITSMLHENIKDMAVLIHRPP